MRGMGDGGERVGPPLTITASRFGTTTVEATHASSSPSPSSSLLLLFIFASLYKEGVYSSLPAVCNALHLPLPPLFLSNNGELKIDQNMNRYDLLPSLALTS